MMNQSSFSFTSQQQTPIKLQFKHGIISSSPFINNNNDCDDEKPIIFQVEDNVVAPTTTTTTKCYSACSCTGCSACFSTCC